MALEKLLDWFGNDKDIRPNKFTIYLGEAIRKAREEKGMSQTDLAKQIYKRRATLSDIENGKTEPDASTLSLIAACLDKPLSHFFPWYMYKNIKQEELTPLEHELLIHFGDIWDDNLKKVAIKQVIAIAEFDPTKTLWDAVDLTITSKEREAELQKFIEQRHKNK
jgi:transcriptional regulator with XRE-family HTH domain